jgi:4a-hydroxytetrahydrobiopterin dehydratase
MMSSETPEFPENSGPTEPLSSREVDLALRDLRGWSRQEGGLRRRFRRASFADAIGFVNQVARLAEDMEHHPDIDIRYRNVIVFLTTHDVGGITRLDLDLAARISELD